MSDDYDLQKAKARPGSSKAVNAVIRAAPVAGASGSSSAAEPASGAANPATAGASDAAQTATGQSKTEQVQVDTQPATAYALLGGDAPVRALVDAFYDLMDLEPRYEPIRKLHPTSLDGSRDKLYWFLSGWLGGPSLYMERFGHPRLRARHLPYPIGKLERDLWLACMDEAMGAEGVTPALRERLQAAFFNTADWMRNAD